MRFSILLSVFLVCLSFSLQASSGPLLKPTRVSETLLSELKKEVKAISFFSLDELALKQIFQSGAKTLDLEIPMPDQLPTILKLQRSEVTTADFIIRTSGGKRFSEPFEKAIHFQGVVDKHHSSIAAISFTSQEISGIFSFGTGNYNLVKLKNQSRGKAIYAVFNDRDILRKNPFVCHSDEGLQQKSKNTKPGGPDEILADNCRRVEVYFECDHQMFQDNGNSVPNTVNFVTSMFNMVSAIYAQSGIVTRISETMVHTLPDDYPTGSSAEALYAFDDSVSIRPPFNGDLAHLLSTVPNANGGRAYLDVLCSKGTGYSNIYPSFLPLPYYSWNVNVVTHELGHNFGSPHTQSCSWEISPGVFGMLDSCYFSEGGCYTGPQIASFGTQMSYCHLMNLGIDMSKGLGPKPGALMRTNYLNSSCLNGTVDLPALFVTKSDTFCSGTNVQLNVTPVTGATYLWSGPNGFTSTLANPVLTNISPNQAGLYSVVVSKGLCSSISLSTRVTVNCIYAISQTNKNICLPGVFSVDFIANIQPAAGNTYSVQLSNTAGSFSNPTVIGTLVSNQKRGSINVSLPNGFPADSGYLVRIISSNPASTGLANPQKLRFNALPAEPVASDVTRCQSGTVQLSATAPGVISWYNSATASTPLATGASYTTPNLSSTTSYWVGSQIAKKVRVGPVVNLLSSDTLMVNNTYHGVFIKVKQTMRIDSITVYPKGAGKLNFNIKDSNNTFTYKTVVVPLVGNINGEKIKIGIEMSPGIYRIDAEASTVKGLIRLNNFYDYPIISEAMDIIGSSVGSRYYFFFDWRLTTLGCPGKRKEVKAIITSPPSQPTVAGAVRCGSGSVTISASGATASQSYRWYTVPTGGTAIAGQTGATYSTPSITSTTTYYVSVFAAAGCESARVPVTATISPSPNSPQTTGANRCGSGSVTVSASGATAGQSYRWYTVATGGTAIAGQTGTTYSTPSITSTTTYYVSVFASAGCESARVPVIATINALPNAPQTTGANRCGNGSVTLSASGATAGQTYRWYTVATGGTAIAGQTGASFSTPALTASTTYYVSILGTGNCESTRQSVVASILSAPPTATLIQSNNFLVASVDTIYQWYRNNVLIGTFSDSLNLNTFGAGSYYAVLIRANGCSTQTNTILFSDVAESKAQNNGITVSPNPGSGMFLVQLPESVNHAYHIFDVQGRKVREGILNQKENYFDLTSFASGIYALKIYHDRMSEVIRIRKE